MFSSGSLIVSGLTSRSLTSFNRVQHTKKNLLAQFVCLCVGVCVCPRAHVYILALHFWKPSQTLALIITCSLGLLHSYQTRVSFHHHYWNSFHSCFLDTPFSGFYVLLFLGVFSSFWENTFSDFLRKCLGGRSFEIASICTVCLHLHVEGPAGGGS